MRTPRAWGTGGPEGSTGGGGGGEAPCHPRSPSVPGRGVGGGRLGLAGGRNNSVVDGLYGGSGHGGGHEDADGGGVGSASPRGRGGDGAPAGGRGSCCGGGLVVAAQAREVLLGLAPADTATNDHLVRGAAAPATAVPADADLPLSTKMSTGTGDDAGTTAVATGGGEDATCETAVDSTTGLAPTPPCV